MGAGKLFARFAARDSPDWKHEMQDWIGNFGFLNGHLLHIAERLPKSVRSPPQNTILLSWSFTWLERAIEIRVMPPMR